MRLLACLIVAPQRGYDEPAILSYAISSFCPTSADGLHLDVQMDYLAGMLALVAAYWLGGLERNKLVQPQPLKDATDGRWRYARLKSNLFACPPLTPKGGNSLYNRLRRRPMQAMGSGTAITQTSDALSAIAGQPLANRARADAYGVCPLSACRTIHSRPRGVNRAFLCTSIRSLRIAKASATSASSERIEWTTY